MGSILYRMSPLLLSLVQYCSVAEYSQTVLQLTVCQYFDTTCTCMAANAAPCVSHSMGAFNPFLTAINVRGVLYQTRG